jgi:tripeptide aminopeptidase
MDPTIIERMLDMAIQIQQIPSPTFAEKQRAEFIRQSFDKFGTNEVIIDDCGNVYIHIRGKNEKHPVIISAHLDTVFPATTDLTCTRTGDTISGPGIGDNSLGLAGLFGLYWYFTGTHSLSGKARSIARDLWLVADVGEEGLGDLRGMKAVVNRFGEDPIAYVVLEGMSLGQIYTRGLGVRRYRIRVHTQGGHSWVDYGSPSAIHEIAELVIKLKNLSIPTEPRSSLNVGLIEGGISVNTIASDASLELDLRSESPRELNHLIELVESLVSDADDKGGNKVHVSAEVIGARPAAEIPSDHALVQTAIECFSREGINVKLNVGSTDANIPLSRGFPAICIGLTTGGGSHTLGEYIDTKPFIQGFRILVSLIQSISRIKARYR